MSTFSRTVELARELIRRPSVTPEDAGCQELLIGRLEALGFEITRLRFGEVENFWARRGHEGPVFAFAGHTDVVPTGPAEKWQIPPFEAAVDKGILHGRGAADMKGGLAAMITALEDFLAECPEPSASLAMLVTSDEEGPSRDGTRKVMEWLGEQDQAIDWCVIGEPSSVRRLGDIVKNGRRGSLGGVLKVIGVQGHVAYPDRADNPIHRVAPALAELTTTVWDEGNEFFPPTSFQISNFHAGTGANNVIPGEAELEFNFRFSTEQTEQGLRERVHEILGRHGVKYELDWLFNGPPFITEGGPLIEAVLDAGKAVTGRETQLSTSGGTSDGRFIAPTGTHVVELGVTNATIHKVNEQVPVAELDGLHAIYVGILERLCA